MGVGWEGLLLFSSPEERTTLWFAPSSTLFFFFFRIILLSCQQLYIQNDKTNTENLEHDGMDSTSSRLLGLIPTSSDLGLSTLPVSHLDWMGPLPWDTIKTQRMI